MRFIDVMMQEKENLQAVIKNCGKLLQHLPRGKLSTLVKNEHLYFQKYVDGKTEYIHAGDDEISRLKDRKLAEIVLDNAENDLQLMDTLLGSYKSYNPNEVVKTFNEVYRDVSQGAVKAMGFAYTMDYDEFETDNPKYPEHLKQTTSEGKKRRSKSEVIIDRIYEELGYDVMYEKTLTFADGAVVSPDYTTWSELRKVELYHEHIGNLEDPDRMEKNIWKFKEYVKNGVYPLDRVLFTFDKPDGGIDAENIKILVKTFMQ